MDSLSLTKEARIYKGEKTISLTSGAPIQYCKVKKKKKPNETRVHGVMKGKVASKTQEISRDQNLCALQEYTMEKRQFL